MRTLSTSAVRYVSRDAAQSAAFRYDAYTAASGDALWRLQQALFTALTGTTFELVFTDLAGAGDGHDFVWAFESHDAGAPGATVSGFADYGAATTFFAVAGPAALGAVSRARIAQFIGAAANLAIAQSWAAGSAVGQRACTMTLGGAAPPPAPDPPADDDNGNLEAIWLFDLFQ